MTTRLLEKLKAWETNDGARDEARRFFASAAGRALLDILLEQCLAGQLRGSDGQDAQADSQAWNQARGFASCYTSLETLSSAIFASPSTDAPPVPAPWDGYPEEPPKSK